jgi:hypothetical protein
VRLLAEEAAERRQHPEVRRPRRPVRAAVGGPA